jgi:hypothetical protein
VKLLKCSIALNLVLSALLIWIFFVKLLNSQSQSAPNADWQVIKTYIFLAYKWDPTNYFEQQMASLDWVSSEFRQKRLGEIETEFDKVKLNQVEQSVEIKSAVFVEDQEAYYVQMQSSIKEAGHVRALSWSARIILNKVNSAMGWEIAEFEAFSGKEEANQDDYWLMPNRLSELEIPCPFESILESESHLIRYFLDVDKTSILKFSLFPSKQKEISFQIACPEKFITIKPNISNQKHTLYRNAASMNWIEKSKWQTLKQKVNKQNFRSMVEKHFGIETVKKK